MWREAAWPAGRSAAGSLLALIGAAAFAVVLSRRRPARIGTSHPAIPRCAVVGNHLERLVVDLETGLRGYIITGQEEFLQPSQAAEASFAQQATTLQQLVADNPAQLARAQRIVRLQGGGGCWVSG